MNANLLSVYPLSAAVNARGHLVIGGCDTVDLAQQWGTPLYVFDEATLCQQCRAHVAAFSERYPETRVIYAGKAYLGVRLAQIVGQEGLGLDVVSGGEMHVARAAGFPAERVCFHGNSKTAAELTAALDWGVGRIAVDNLYELGLIEQLAASRRTVVPILLRLAPGVDPHTHRYIATGIADSKFGLPIAGGMADEAVARSLASPWLRLEGYHAHIGSQIHDLDAYGQTAALVLAFAARMKERHGYVPREISLGGGWAASYLLDEPGPSLDEVAGVICGALRSACQTHGLPLPLLSVEPGRAIVARAGVALYTIGARKEIPGVRTYVFVDGGMADNIRPALYQAHYTAVVANRMNEAPAAPVTVAGRYCESGDVLLWDAALPATQPGDILAVATCGAYTLSMASNYNMALRPAVVAVADGRSTLWRRRETLDDLLACEV